MAAVLGAARARINVPPPPVATGGFLTAANVIDVGEGAHELMGAEYVTDACTGGNNNFTGNWCPASIPAQCTDPGAPVAAKTFDLDNDVVTGDPFVAYAGSACDIRPLGDQLSSAVAGFNYGERRSVDAALTAWLAVQATDMEFTGAVSCVLGQMEAFLAMTYGGVGLIAMALPSVVAAAGDGTVYPDSAGAGLITAVGTPVAAYAPAVLADSYPAWAMGQLTLIRGPLRSFSVPPMVRGDGTCEPARALAERIYVPLVECVVGEFTMTCCPCAGGTTP